MLLSFLILLTHLGYRHLHKVLSTSSKSQYSYSPAIRYINHTATHNAVACPDKGRSALASHNFVPRSAADCHSASTSTSASSTLPNVTRPYRRYKNFSTNISADDGCLSQNCTSRGRAGWMAAHTKLGICYDKLARARHHNVAVRFA